MITVLTQDNPRIAIYFEHLFPESRGGGERQYGGFAEEWARAGAQVTYLTREHHPSDATVERGFAVEFIAPQSGVYDESGTRSATGALSFTLATLRSVRRRRSMDDCVMVSSTPALLAPAARAGMAPSRGRMLIVDWLEVWTHRQWRDYLGATKGTAAWAVQALAVWSTPTATCHSALVERRLKSIRPGIRVLRSPGLIDASADPGSATAEAVPPPYGLFVGRLIKDKNPDSLPAAIALVRRELPDFHCLIVGRGPELANVQAAAVREEVQAAITFTSGITDEELSDAMAGATCLIHPSQREGYGLVVVEAAQHGTPAVVVNAPDNAAVELIEEGINGFRADSTGARDLATAILQCVNGGPQLRATTRGWYEQARTSRSLQLTARRILDFIASHSSRHRP